MPILLILFIGVPIAEIALFIEIGGWIGLWPTLGTILVTALIGTLLVRAQGMAVLAEARREMDKDRAPVKAALTGVCLLVAGALLLTPGFLTDAIGFLLLIPPVRMAIGLALVRRIVTSGRFHVHQGGGFHNGPGGPAGGGSYRGTGARGGGPIIDGDYETVERPEDAPRRDNDMPSDRLPPGSPSQPSDSGGEQR